MLPHVHAITDAAIHQARADQKFHDAQVAAGAKGFTIDATPRSSDDPKTLTLPMGLAVPDDLIKQLVDLASYLRGRAVDGRCIPVTINVRAKPRHAPN